MNNRFETNKGLLPKFQHEQKFLGVCIGWVIDNKDPDKLGRVKVKLPWLKDSANDQEDFETDWCRLVQFYAGTERGSFIIPEIIGRTVWRHFGIDYGFFPLFLPLVGLYWLFSRETLRAYGISFGRFKST